jgi:hypothetical protein
MPFAAPACPGIGPGWEKLALTLRATLPREEIDGVWAFKVIRREGRDFGTAIVSRVEAGRCRIYTATFVYTVKGPKRGTFESEIIEVGSGPPEALDELLALVPRRSEEEEPPVPVDPSLWFPGSADPASA